MGGCGRLWQEINGLGRMREIKRIGLVESEMGRGRLGGSKG